MHLIFNLRNNVNRIVQSQLESAAIPKPFGVMISAAYSCLKLIRNIRKVINKNFEWK